MGRAPDLLSAEDFPVSYGRYTLLGVLGEGGMARVFRAELQGPSGFRKAAAVKVIRSSIAAANERVLTSLINEARLGGLLQHSNIVETYDFGEMEGLPFIAMELVRGLELNHLVELASPLDARHVLDIGTQLCAGLDAAHNLEDAGVETELIHRDLKPSNIIVSRDGTVKILDFGIAKAAEISSDVTSPGMTKGTPAYMSPEQLDGDEVDRRSDLFALGLVLYEIATGRRFFAAGSPMAVFMAVYKVEERLAEETFAEVEAVVPGLGAVLRRCLRADPGARFDSARQVEAELARLAVDVPPATSLRHLVRTMMAAEGIPASTGGSAGMAALTSQVPRPAGNEGLPEPGPTRAFPASAATLHEPEPQPAARPGQAEGAASPTSEPGPTRAFAAGVARPPDPSLGELALPESIPGAPVPGGPAPAGPGPTRAFPAGAARPLGPAPDHAEEPPGQAVLPGAPPRTVTSTPTLEARSRRVGPRRRRARRRRRTPLLLLGLGGAVVVLLVGLLLVLLWDPSGGRTPGPASTDLASALPATGPPAADAGRTAVDSPTQVARSGRSGQGQPPAFGDRSGEPTARTAAGRKPEGARPDRPDAQVGTAQPEARGQTTGEPGPAGALTGTDSSDPEAAQPEEQPQPAAPAGDRDHEEDGPRAAPRIELAPITVGAVEQTTAEPAVPEATPEPTPEVTPSPTPEPTPEVTPSPTPEPTPSVSDLPPPRLGPLKAQVVRQAHDSMDVEFRIQASGAPGLGARLFYRFTSESSWRQAEMRYVGKGTFEVGRALPIGEVAGKVQAYVHVSFGEGQSTRSGTLSFDVTPF